MPSRAQTCFIGPKGFKMVKQSSNDSDDKEKSKLFGFAAAIWIF